MLTRILFATLMLFSNSLLAAPSSDEILTKILTGIWQKSAAAARIFPASGFQNGLAGFMSKNRLVFTYAEGSCSNIKAGVCQITAYITRAGYKKYRTDGAFCGAMVTWEASEKNMKKWTPTSGLSQNIASGNEGWALVMIDNKNDYYCK